MSKFLDENGLQNYHNNLKLQFIRMGDGEGSRIISDSSSSQANGKYSLSQGTYVHANGDYSTCFGNGGYSSGKYSFVAGSKNKALNEGSIALGNTTTSEGVHTLSSGYKTCAIGDYSFTRGLNGVAIGKASVFEGNSYFTPAEGYKHFSGQETVDIKSLSILDWENNWFTPQFEKGSIPEYRYSLAYGEFSHVEGENNLAFGPFSHVEGHLNISRALGCHVEGVYNIGMGKQSHVEGSSNLTFGDFSHSEGRSNTAMGNGSHVEGRFCVSGYYPNTTTDYAKVSAINEKTITVTLNNSRGYGQSETYICGDISRPYLINDKFVAYVEKYVDGNLELVVEDVNCVKLNNSITLTPLIKGPLSTEYNTYYNYAYNYEQGTTLLYLNEDFYGNDSSEIILYSSYTGYYPTRLLSVDWSARTILVNRVLSEIDNRSGLNMLIYTTVSNKTHNAHHSEGINTITTGVGTHSEGYRTKATGYYTHTEGNGSYTSGYASHAEGVNTQAIASPSHAEGTGTVADEINLTVVGKYNVTKYYRKKKEALFIVGNGNSTSNRSDAFTVFNDGTIHTKKWSQTTWILLGDSITGNTSYNSSSINLSGKRYFELIKEKNGIKTINYAVSGTGYKRQSDESSSNKSGSASNAFWNIVQNIEELSENNSPVVTIFGSFNDLLHYSNLGTVSDTGTNTICGCINTTIDTIYSKCPLARICIVTPTPWYTCVPEDVSGQGSLYVDKLIEICHLKGIPCLDLFHNSALQPRKENVRQKVYIENTTSATHLNDIGHSLIASRFEAMLDTLII